MFQRERICLLLCLVSIVQFQIEFSFALTSAGNNRVSDECVDYTVCGAMGRQPCNAAISRAFEEASCGPCINGFVQMSDKSRICRRCKFCFKFRATKLTFMAMKLVTNFLKLLSNSDPYTTRVTIFQVTIT